MTDLNLIFSGADAGADPAAGPIAAVGAAMDFGRRGTNIGHLSAAQGDGATTIAGRTLEVALAAGAAGGLNVDLTGHGVGRRIANAVDNTVLTPGAGQAGLIDDADLDERAHLVPQARGRAIGGGLGHGHVDASVDTGARDAAAAGGTALTGELIIRVGYTEPRLALSATTTGVTVLTITTHHHHVSFGGHAAVHGLRPSVAARRGVSSGSAHVPGDASVPRWRPGVSTWGSGVSAAQSSVLEFRSDRLTSV